MDRSGVLVLLWLALLVLLVPVVTPVQYGVVRDADVVGGTPGAAVVLVEPDRVAAGDVVRYWDADGETFRVREVRSVSPDGYVVAAPEEVADDRVVSPFAVVGAAVSVGGRPVAIPLLGYVVPFLETVEPLVLTLFLLVSAALVVAVRRRRRSHRRRDVLRVKQAFLPLFVVVAVVGLTVTPLGASTHQLSYDARTVNATVAAANETVIRTVTVGYRQPAFTHLVVDVDGVGLVDWEQGDGALSTTLELPADRRTLGTVSAFPYLAVLPRSVVVGLHAVHPIAAIFGTTGVVLGPLLAAYLLLVDGTRPAPRWLRRLLG